jgi:hypothetical protein
MRAGRRHRCDVREDWERRSHEYASTSILRTVRVCDNRAVLVLNSNCSELVQPFAAKSLLIFTGSLSWPALLPITDSSMPRGGICSARSEEGPVASIPVAAANQTAQLGVEPQSAVQAQSATTKPAQSNAVQDTVTLSNGVPQPTHAEEAGLFQVAAPAITTLSTAAFGGASNGAAPKPADTAAAAVNAPAAIAATPKAPAAQNAATAQPGANNANVAGAGTPAATNAPQAAKTPTTSAAQSAPASSTQSQNQLLQFTEYLQQLGLTPQAQSQMIDAARLLNDLDPPAFQQAIVALRAEAASLAARPGSASPAPTPTANAAPSQGGAAASTQAQPAASNPTAGAARQ